MLFDTLKLNLSTGHAAQISLKSLVQENRGHLKYDTDQDCAIIFRFFYQFPPQFPLFEIAYNSLTKTGHCDRQ